MTQSIDQEWRCCDKPIDEDQSLEIHGRRCHINVDCIERANNIDDRERYVKSLKTGLWLAIAMAVLIILSIVM